MLERPAIDSPIPFPDQYITFFTLFNERRYYDAHEVLEDLWVMETGTEKNYYKGLIMLTIGLEHLRRGNLAPAKRLQRDALSYLKPYSDVTMGFELSAFVEQLALIFNEAEEAAKTNAPTLTNVGAHPRLRLIQVCWD